MSLKINREELQSNREKLEIYRETQRENPISAERQLEKYSYPLKKRDTERVLKRTGLQSQDSNRDREHFVEAHHVNQYGIPKLKVEINRLSSTGERSRYAWKVTLLSSDASGRRDLGYRCSGTVSDDMTGLGFDGEVEVHDENIDRWTPMNPSDRPDIRKKIISLVTKGIQQLKKGGKDSFEHTIA